MLGLVSSWKDRQQAVIMRLNDDKSYRRKCMVLSEHTVGGRGPSLFLEKGVLEMSIWRK